MSAVKGATPSRSTSSFLPLFRSQHFLTRSTLYVEVVLKERDQAIMECRTHLPQPYPGSVADLYTRHI